MENSERGVGKPARVTDMDFVNQARTFAHHCKIRSGKASQLALLNVPPTQQEICDSLFDLAQATQAALTANNCAGV